MKRISPMLAGGVLCTVALVGSAAFNHGGQPKGSQSPSKSAEALSPEAPVALQPVKPKGSELALWLEFGDLDLRKLADVQEITPASVSSLPEAVQTLDGQIVRLRGFMKPQLIATGIPQFLLVRSTDFFLRFGPMMRADHLAVVTLKAGTTTDYIEIRPFEVEGRFRVKVGEVDGVVFALYHIDNAVIIHR